MLGELLEHPLLDDLALEAAGESEASLLELLGEAPLHVEELGDLRRARYENA